MSKNWEPMPRVRLDYQFDDEWAVSVDRTDCRIIITQTGPHEIWFRVVKE
jgi:hypothetical protein